MCLNDDHLTFSFKILADSATVLGDIDNFTSGMSSILNANNDSSMITFENVTEANGVTTVHGYLSPYQNSDEQTFGNGLLSGIPGVIYSITNIQVGST